jgi:hypothetical protein
MRWVYTTLTLFSLELQHAIVTTIYFLTAFYSYRPTIHLRHMYLRWNLARNKSSGDVSGKLADSFEEKVLSPFSVAQSKGAIVHSPQTQLSIQGEAADSKILTRLVDLCCQNHRRAHFGVLPQEVSKLCIYSSVSEALSYIGLQDLMSRSHLTGGPIVHHITLCLGNMAVHGQTSSEQGDHEGLLPLLQLLRDLVTMQFPVERGEVYRAVMPFYMWPVAHAECSRRLLSLLAMEGKVSGTSFRRKLLVESNLGLQLKNTEIRGQLVHMLVDISTHASHGAQFSGVFTNRHDLPTSEALHRMIIRSCFKSVFPTHEMLELETRLQRLSPKALVGVCCECVEVMEGGVTREDGEFSDGMPEDIVSEMNKIHQRIVQETDQRDSALSCGGSESGGRDLSEETLGVFPLPSPDVPTHTLDPCKYPQVQAKLREVLVQCQKQVSPVATSQRTFSQTSMDSTGSSYLVEGDTSRTPLINHLTGGKEASEAGGLDALVVQSNGHCEEEEEEEDVESCDNHVASPDSGHVMSPDPVTSFSPPPMLSEEETHVKTRRSLSTEIAPSAFHSQDQNGDTTTRSQNTSDEVFNQTPNSQGSSSSDQSPQMRGRGKLIRRKTVPAKLHPPSSSPRNRGTRTSIITHAPSYGTSRKGYHNIAGTPTVPSSAIPLGSRILSTRRGSMSLPKKTKKVALGRAGSPVHDSSPKYRVLKVILAGSDQLVCHTAKAYAYFLAEEPNLLTGLDVRFYHVPLSTASTADWLVPERSATAGRDSPETVVGEPANTCGCDVNIGRYMSHLDSWYERNVALAVHHSLRLLPPIMDRNLSPLLLSSDAHHIRPPLTPSKIVIDSVAHYLREANHCIRAKLYKIKMILKTEKQHKMDNREMYMLHRLDIQRLTGKKSHRQAKPFEANLQLTELSLDGSYIRPDVTPLKDVLSVRASNIPSYSDPTVANPESECFELSVVTAHSEGSRFIKSRLTEQTNYHTNHLTLETKKDPLTVMVDGDSNGLIDNVIRLEIMPAYLGGVAPPMSGTAGENRTNKQLFLPLMTFWPIDL